MKKVKLTRFTGYVLVIVAITLIILSATYARYVTNVTGSATATAAKWSFTVKHGSNTTIDIDLAETTPTYVNMAEGVIAPGATGSFVLTINAGDSEVSVGYEVSLALAADCPAGLKLYSDSSYTTGLSSKSGVIAYEDGVTNKEENITVYWKWDYLPDVSGIVDPDEAANAINDANDDDTSFEGDTFTATINVKGFQVAPSTT